MTGHVRIATAEGIARITIDNPPLNLLGAPVRRGLAAALEAAGRNPAVQVIVLAAAGATWPAGADIHEFGKPAEGPALGEICAAVAQSRKPVIAALHGTVLGGGLELALAAALRLAEPGTALGLPEVTLGLLPGAGGTQRLPRLVGAKAALGLLLSGLPVAARRAAEIGLVDMVTEGGAEAAAEALARTFVAGGAELPTAAERAEGRSLDPEAWLAAVAAARAGLGPARLPAPARIIDCVEAALLLPEDEGFAYERTAFGDLVETPEAAALSHAFLAERRAARQDDLGAAAARQIARAGILGTGEVAAELAVALMALGIDVTLVGQDGQSLSAGLARVAALLEREVAGGRLSAAGRRAEWAQIAGGLDPADLATADLILLAGADAAAGAGLRRIAGVARPGAVIAVCARALSARAPGLDPAAAGFGRAADLAGIALPPLPGARLLEIVTLPATAPEVTATLAALAAHMGRQGVRTFDGRSLGARVFAAGRQAADLMVEAGASPYGVDRALKDYGFAAGLYEMVDRAGLGAAGGPAGGQAGARDAGFAAAIAATGRAGRATGGGYYRWPEGADGPEEDREVLTLIGSERRGRGIVPRRVTAPEIRARVLAAMANAGAELIETGAARCPSDIDVAMMAGWGFPRWKGGPMQVADALGLLALRKELRDHARDGEAVWQPAALFDEMIKNGLRFSDLNVS
ncbi:enoyl-CoA hydratase-related protein [Albidovulum sp.]|uniref:enoyl-CoA hydratase-related protein n=1 Tax=Albidovulum sp. TaxID=1872424 RepID=UPI0039B8A2C3